MARPSAVPASTPGDGHPLLLADGQILRPLVGPVLEAKRLQQRIRPLIGFGPRHAR